jgi:hypothetical protein
MSGLHVSGKACKNENDGWPKHQTAPPPATTEDREQHLRSSKGRMRKVLSYWRVNATDAYKHYIVSLHMYTCLYMYTCVHSYMCTRAYIHTCVHVRTFIHVYTCTHIHVHMYTHTRA